VRHREKMVIKLTRMRINKTVSTQGATMMKHSQDEISEIWNNVTADKYAGSSAHHQPVICSDDDAEQCISIPNSEGTDRELYSRKNKDEEWKVVPYVGERKS
tara:strand:- start:194 stop:499 length:306 start_codon:yes stop_codon:yes gene_type:complete